MNDTPPEVLEKIAQQLPSDNEIMAYLKRSGGRVKRGTIAKYFKLKGAQRRGLRLKLKHLAQEGVVVLARDNFVEVPAPLPATLTLEIHHQDPDDLTLIAQPVQKQYQRAGLVIYVDSQMNLNIGDKIEARLTHMEGSSYVAHPIRRVGGDADKLIMGAFTSLGKGKPGQVVPLDPSHLPRRYLVAAEAVTSLTDGAVVMAKPLPVEGSTDVPMLEIIEVVGDQSQGLESLIAIHNFDIPYEFPQDVIDAAEVLPGTLSKKTIGEREDLRKIPLVTIDGPDARDFDDAVFVEETPNGGFSVIVAIADVAEYIEEGSPLDKEAFKRGNSTYFPDRVVPMLPERISNDLCSLRPNEDRPVLAVHMAIDKSGVLVKHKFTRAVIHSHGRLTYAQVMDAINGNFDDLTKDLWPQNLAAAHKCYKALLQARQNRHALDLDMPETAILVGPDGSITKAEKRERNDAHRLIEELMIVANVAAAQALSKKKAPCLYRVHPSPTPEKLETLKNILKHHKINMGKTANLEPQDFTNLIKKVKGLPEEDLLMQSILRSQQQAVYTPENKGHFGLALNHYAHYTSPIRRYSDLLVHRSLIKAFNLPGQGQLKAEPGRFADLAEHICITERRSQRAEWDAKDRLVARYYQTKLGDVFDGVVVSVQKFGLFVTIEEGVGEGLVPMRLMGDEYFRFDEQKNVLIGSKTNAIFRVGTKTQVTLTSADTVSGQLTFALGEVDIKDLPSRHEKGGRGPRRGSKSGAVRRPKRAGAKSNGGSANIGGRKHKSRRRKP